MLCKPGSEHCKCLFAEPVVILPPLAKPCPPSGGALGLLDQLSSLVMHGPFKMALLHAVRSSSKYAELFAYLLNMLELPSEEMSHVQAQEGILVSTSLHLLPNVSGQNYQECVLAMEMQ